MRTRDWVIRYLIPIRSWSRLASWKYGSFPGNFVDYSKIKICSMKNLELGGNLAIGGFSRLYCEGGLKIGYNTHIAQGAFIMTTNHNYKNSKLLPFDEIGLLHRVEIGKNCWIGAYVMICPGVPIGDSAVVAMGSVVTKSVPRGAVVGGNPARIIKYRDMDTLDELEKKMDSFIQRPSPHGHITWQRVEGFKPELEF